VSLELNIFRPQAEMPEVGYGDVMVISQAKVFSSILHSLTQWLMMVRQVQAFQSANVSLLTSVATRLRVYEAAKISKPPRDPTPALRTSAKPGTAPSPGEKAFVSLLYHLINKERLPAPSEYEVMKVQSVNIKDKYSTLKDVQQGMYTDTIVEVVREPYWLGDKYTLWVSDYTENSAFFEHSFGRGKSPRGQVGDPFGILPQNKEEQDWAGPFGQRSMQVTCFFPHADVVRDHPVSKGSWIKMRNLHIKFGHNNANLEGFLHEDKRYPERINLFPLDLSDHENLSQELKDTIRRRKEYEKAYKSERKELDNTIENKRKQLDEAAAAGAKRRADIGLEPAPSAKRNRKERRAHLQKAAAEDRQAATTQTTSLPDGLVKEMSDPPPSVPDLNPQSTFIRRLHWSRILTKQFNARIISGQLAWSQTSSHHSIASLALTANASGWRFPSRIEITAPTSGWSTLGRPICVTFAIPRRQVLHTTASPTILVMTRAIPTRMWKVVTRIRWIILRP